MDGREKVEKMMVFLSAAGAICMFVSCVVEWTYRILVEEAETNA